MGATSPSDEHVLQHALTLRTDLAAAEVFAELGPGGLEAVLVRGPAIARRLYGPGERQYGDADLLVPDRSRPAVEQVLSGLGYAPYAPAGRARPWRRPSDGAVVDVHVSLWGAARGPAVWNAFAARREPMLLGPVEVAVPDLAATALVVVLHASQHGALASHVRVDLTRALDRFDRDTWKGALACARECGALTAFRQGLTMLPAGRDLLAGLGLTPLETRQSALRRRGVELPTYLFESLTLRERLTLIGSRLLPSRSELAAYVEPRAATSTRWLVAAHGRRLSRLPGRALRLARRWRS